MNDTERDLSKGAGGKSERPGAAGKAEPVDRTASRGRTASLDKTARLDDTQELPPDLAASAATEEERNQQPFPQGGCSWRRCMTRTRQGSAGTGKEARQRPGSRSRAGTCATRRTAARRQLPSRCLHRFCARWLPPGPGRPPEQRAPASGTADAGARTEARCTGKRPAETAPGSREPLARRLKRNSGLEREAKCVEGGAVRLCGQRRW